MASVVVESEHEVEARPAPLPLTQADAAVTAVDFEDLTQALKAAGEPTRLRLLMVLVETELTVTELTQVMGQSQPRISRHLRLLQEAGLVQRFPEGSWVFYRAIRGHPLVEALVAWTHTDRSFEGDRQRLRRVHEARQKAASAYFARHAAEWDHISALHIPETVLDAALREIVGSGRIKHLIDLGTGTGRMLLLFGPQTEKGLGLDVSLDMLAIARANLKKAGLPQISVRQGDLYAPDLLSESAPAEGADLVVIHQVLHYLADPSAAIKRAAGLVCPGGRLLVVDFAPHRVEELRTHHAHRRLGFPESDVTGWLQEAGLADVAVRHMPPGDGARADYLTVSIWLAERAVTADPARSEKDTSHG